MIEYLEDNSKISKALEYLNKLEWISVDTETTGLSPHLHEILLLQLGDYNTQFVINTKEVDILLFKELLESKNLILQNAKFDLGFFYKLNIIPQKKIWDTMLAEQIIYNGYPIKTSLDALALTYCNIQLNKSIRLNFSKKNFTLSNEEIIYAADDIKYLERIKNAQEGKANSLKMLRAVLLENEFVKALAYVEFCGIYLDKDKWIKKVNTASKELEKLEDELDKWLINKFPKYKQNQLDLFANSGLKRLRKATINWNSQKQLIPIFEKLGINVKSDNKSGKSISEKILSKQKNKTELIPIYLKYQIIKKDFSTYGENFLNHINKNTGRIHPEFNQLMNTGRLSCNNPNLQNLPADERTRSCFTAQNNNVLINSDYTAQEDIIFVNNSKEKKMIEFYQSDINDGHSYVAKLCFPEKIKDTPIEEIKKKFPDLRTKAKAAKFALHYSGTGKTIADNLSISEDEGNRIEAAYFKAFPDIKKYLNTVMEKAKKRGFILLSPITGRRFFFANFRQAKENDDWYSLYKFSKLACNYPIQSQSAEVTKIATIYFLNWIINSGYFNVVKIINLVHDEIDTEAPKELQDIVAKNLKESMEKGGKAYSKIVPLKATVEISKYWKH